MSTKDTGDLGEQYACTLLLENGYTIVERNWHSRYGEIDIVAQKEDVIAFVEVKTRSGKALDQPAAWVDVRKQEKIIKTAMLFLNEYPKELQPRFDVIEVVLDSTGSAVFLEHLENAFDATDR